ncbi:permease [Actinosynnema pretiosum subsp. pretiosum]|uniref:Permease n=1 Tax=Actinosynnema pretiosum subsp. pretiosum TaxID=103721 RepID=A0AA45L7H5_9PSEU|nr:hypothetical protein APASM_3832 [Actinosynnema pretiosum subsp. pretiosum]QUF04732.1 permease [Actinosynnema pretiosum subsp. pretiosum]
MTRTATALRPEEGLLLVSCCREKLVTTTPVPAFDIYQGALVPLLRDRLAPEHRARVRVLSAEHGVLAPTDPVGTYDHKLRSRHEAHQLSQRVAARLARDLEAPALRHVLVALEPLYQAAAQCLHRYAPPLTLTLLPNPSDWPGTAAVLNEWGWL